MVSTPVLALPDFSKPFILETDASGVGVGAVLMQNGRPIAFMSKQLCPKHQALSIYEREFLAILMAIQRWRHYLQGQKFIIKTDQQALKHLLDQKVITPMQQKWVTKLLGYNYEIHYKKGSENKVADALSRRGEEESTNYVISTVTPVWAQQVQGSYHGDDFIQKILENKALKSDALPDWEVIGDILRYKGKIVVGATTDLRQVLLKELHNSSYGGHSGILGTYERVKRLFYWPNLKKDVIAWVQTCDVCNRSKPTGGLYPGLLQPLPIPEQAWTHISMDFIEGLPKTQGKDVILVVVDRLTKYGHFLPLSHPFTAQSVAKVFMEHIYKLHGQPLRIVTDRDKVFTSSFWKELFKAIGTSLDMTSAYHPQSDGQTERLNQCLETYLRCMVQQNPKKWLQLVALAEFWYNTNYHSSLKMTPFEALYGYPPPIHSMAAYLPVRESDARTTLLQYQQRIQELKENLIQAQNRMKVYADKKRQEREFQVGDMVYLKLQPFRQNSVSLRKNLKLSSRYYGPYSILERIGKVAYKLDLPDGSRIHPVFHVSLLKGTLSPSVAPTQDLPVVDEDGTFIITPTSAMAYRKISRNGRQVQQVMVKWVDGDSETVTWEDVVYLKKKFPKFDPWGQGSLDGGGIVMNSTEIKLLEGENVRAR